jgi:hypothetical protein
MSPKLREPDEVKPEVIQPTEATGETTPPEPTEQTVKVSVYLPLGLAEKLAAYSVRYRCDRSHVVAVCLQAFLGSMAIQFRGTKAPDDLRVA